MLCGRARNTLPFDLSLVFITLGEPQAHEDRYCEAVGVEGMQSFLARSTAVLLR